MPNAAEMLCRDFKFYAAACLMVLGIWVAKCECGTVEQIQTKNLELLQGTLTHGWRAFCGTPVEEGVMLLHKNINPSEATIHVMTITNHSVELPIKHVSELRDFDISPKRKTLLYVNGFYTSDVYFSIQAHLKLLQTTRRDLNVILVDFAKDVQQLFYAVRHHVKVQGYFVARILNELVEHGCRPEDITLAGHSVGANIAALGANLYAAQTQGTRMGQFVAIDPALMCQHSDIYVSPNVSTRVVVIHGEGNVFGVREPLGTIDIYPNGVGLSTRRRQQPGCDRSLCSHMYSFVLFTEALIEGVVIPAVKCDSWPDFKRGICDHNDVVSIGLAYPAKATGLYFCMTQPNPPFTYMEHGLKYRNKL